MSARPARRTRAAASAVVLAMATAFIAPPSPPIAARPAHRVLADEAATAAAAEAMFTRLNDARIAHGLQPYRASPLLASVAAGHAREVADHQHYSHTGLDGRSAKQRMADAGYGAGRSGVRTSENFVARAKVDEAFQWLMDDKDHRPNMLDARFREVGVGAAPTSYGFVWVLDFGMYDGVDDAQPVARATVGTSVAAPTVVPTTVVPPTAVVTATPLATATAMPTATEAPTGTSVSTGTEVVSPTAVASPAMPTAAASVATAPGGRAAEGAPTRAPGSGRSGITVLAVLGGVALLGLLGVLGLSSKRRTTDRLR